MAKCMSGIAFSDIDACSLCDRELGRHEGVYLGSTRFDVDASQVFGIAKGI